MTEEKKEEQGHQDQVECPWCLGTGKIDSRVGASARMAIRETVDQVVDKLTKDGPYPPSKMAEPKPECRRFRITREDVKLMGRKGIKDVASAVSMVKMLCQEHSDYKVIDVSDPEPDGSQILTILYRIPVVEGAVSLYGIQFEEVVDEDNQEGDQNG